MSSDGSIVPRIGHAPAYFKNLREHFRDQGAGHVHLSMLARGVALIELDSGPSYRPETP